MRRVARKIIASKLDGFSGLEVAMLIDLPVAI
jgi:hypothetical protein